MSLPRVAIVGATGAVGAEFLELLAQRNFPFAGLKLLASARSAGKTLAFRGEEIRVEELTQDSFADIDLALFSAGGSTSKTFAPVAAAAGAMVVDNSSAFRMDPEVPLVVPEINGDEIARYLETRAAAGERGGIIANPNCTTIISCMALAPLHQLWRLSKVIASSYQAVSGSGAQGMVELETQTRAWAAGETVEAKLYPRQILSNCIPLVGPIEANGYTQEEMKLQSEGRKILRHSTMKASATCVRVPVFRSHSVTLAASFERECSVEEARKAIAAFPGVRVVDDRDLPDFPTPLDTTGKDECLVGRIRRDLVFDNGLSFWVVGDQVRKGAALNAVQIAERWAEVR